MAIEKVEMYTVVCDHCKKDMGSTDDYSCWNDDTYAEERAMESEWIKENGKHYCPECVTYGENDELQLKEEMFNKYSCGEPTIYEKAIALWGNQAQLEMLNEEATELALAARKFLRQTNEERFNELAGEAADVEIMLEQFKTMFPESVKIIDNFKKFKLNRLKERIEKQSFEG